MDRTEARESVSPGYFHASDKEIGAMLARNTPVEIASLDHQPSLMRTSLRQPIEVALVFITLPMTLVIVGALWLESPRGLFSVWQFAILGIFGLLLTLGMVWLVAVAGSTFGIAIVDEG